MAKYEYHEAKAPRSKGKVIDHVRIRKGEDGGHLVEHHYADDGMTFHKPAHHVFGKEEGEEMLEHVAEHMGVGRASKAEEEAEGEE